MIKLRAHHGMCFLHFIGKGYSSSFVENMFSHKHLLEKINPEIEIISKIDHVCEKCPNNKNNECKSLDKVNRYDNEVLKYLNIKSGTIIKYSEFSKLVKEKIINTNKRENICSDCEWNEICKNIKF